MPHPPLQEKKIEISEENQDILKNGRIDGNLYFLPQVQLSRDKYLEINKVLEICGGKWNRSKKAHIFESEEKAKQVIDAQEKGEVVDKKKTYQFFETPKNVARKMVELADLKSEQIILEPSAGHGAIAEALAEYDHEKPLYNMALIMVEIDPEKCKVLEEKKIGNVLCEDFLGTFAEQYGEFPRILMNPPFTRGQDAEHVLHAYEKCLEYGGKLVSIMSASVTFNKQKKYQKVRELIEKNGEVIKLEPNAFKESGTNVNTVIVVLNK